MHRALKGVAALTGATAALLGLSLFAPGEAYAQKTVTIVLPEEPDSLDSCNSARSAVGRVNRQNVVESLVELDPNDGKITPRLATSWEQTNPTTWRFKLREGVKYSDGTPLTPAGVAKSIDKALDPSLDCNARTKTFSGFKIKGVPVDANTLDITTPTPDPILPVRLTQLTISQPDEPIKILRDAIGTGPYIIDHWTANTEIVLKRNPNYWGKKPVLDGAKYVWRTESAVAAAMVKVGEADLAPNISKGDATDKTLDFAYPNSETNYFRIESQIPPLTDVRVRKAINAAIDRKALLGTIIPPEAQVATQMVIPRIAGHNFDVDKNPSSPYDPAKAKALLAEAKKDGVPVDKEIIIVGRINYYPNGQEHMEAVMNMLNAVGFNMKLIMYEVNQWTSINRQPFKEDRGPTIVQSMHDNNNGDAVFSAYPRYGCQGISSNTCDPKLEELILKAPTLSGAEREKTWQEAFRYIYEDMVADVNMFHMVGFSRVGPRIDFKPSVATNSEIQIAQMKFK